MIRGQNEIKTQTSISKGLSSVATVESKIMPYSGFINFLFYFFAACLVIPIIDVPLLGLSLTAPIMFLIAVPCLFKPLRPWFHTYRLWISLALTIFIMILISMIINGITGKWGEIETRGILYLVRYAYWLVAFVIVVYFTSQGQIIKKLPVLLGWCVLVLALLRWGEVFILGNYIGTARTFLFTQNSYGLLFSIFSPFLLVMIFQQRGLTRILAILGNLVLWGVVIVNGSRGSWISIAIGLVLTILLFFLTNPKRFSGLLILLLILSGLLIVMSRKFPDVSKAIQDRFTTLESLSEDESALVRQLMIQKGVRIFKASPIIGAGVGQFTQVEVELNLPRLLSGGSSGRFDSISSHNSYIQTLAEFGLIGSVPFAILLIILFIRGGTITLKSMRNNDVLPLAVFLSFIQMSAHMWVISSLTGTVTWFIYGLMGAVIMQYKNQQ